VQTIFTQTDGSGVKLSIARYYLPKTGAKSRKETPDGAYLSGGIEPDVKVELDSDTEYEWANPERDAQLKAALVTMGIN
jgi:carboxyl-terminal processing protease